MQNDDKIEFIHFKEVDINDPFFDSLKNDYQGFESWFDKKKDEKAFVSKREDGTIQDFLYLKAEDGVLNDIEPVLSAKKRLKVGTFKIDIRRTLRGERFIKKIFDIAVEHKYEEIYLTLFSKQKGLVRLFTKYGFTKIGTKGKEDVYLKEVNRVNHNLILDYPKFSINECNKWVLGINPEFHTKMFPDSRLLTEKDAVLKDLSPTNSIYKCYVTDMREINKIKSGDLVIMYRTKDESRPNANYSSVCTSICTVLENKMASSYTNLKDYINQVSRYNIFDEKALTTYYLRQNTHVLTMTYNAAFKNRIVKNSLLKLINEPDYWGLFQLTNNEFELIYKAGELDENYIID